MWKLCFVQVIKVTFLSLTFTSYELLLSMVWSSCDMKDDQPVSGEIDDLNCDSKSGVLISRGWHFHSYEVSASPWNSFFVYRHLNFVQYHPLHLSRQFEPSGKLSVCMKEDWGNHLTLDMHMHNQNYSNSCLIMPMKKLYCVIGKNFLLLVFYKSSWMRTTMENNQNSNLFLLHKLSAKERCVICVVRICIYVHDNAAC